MEHTAHTVTHKQENPTSFLAIIPANTNESHILQPYVLNIAICAWIVMNTANNICCHIVPAQNTTKYLDLTPQTHQNRPSKTIAESLKVVQTQPYVHSKRLHAIESWQQSEYIVNWSIDLHSEIAQTTNIRMHFVS